jgi:hypothetical protein
MIEPFAISHLDESQFDAAIRAAAERYPFGNPAGVLGATIARKRVRGRIQPEVTVALLVERKLEAPASPVEAITFEDEGAMYSLAPDVVALGSHEPRARSLVQGCMQVAPCSLAAAASRRRARSLASWAQTRARLIC